MNIVTFELVMLVRKENKLVSEFKLVGEKFPRPMGPSQSGQRPLHFGMRMHARLCKRIITDNETTRNKTMREDNGN